MKDDCSLCARAFSDRDGPEDPKHPTITGTAHWVVVLAPNQALLGRCIARTRRHVESVGDLTDAEVLELRDLMRRMEDAARRAFGATMFNWSCDMNLSYRNNPPDPHVHWWMVPRYAVPVDFGGVRFEDPQFASPYPHDRWLEVDKDLHQRIATALRAAMEVPSLGRSAGVNRGR
jgi:diadenosine tetraphosphate (Ap4A) HIT family hydrolase